MGRGLGLNGPAIKIFAAYQTIFRNFGIFGLLRKRNYEVFPDNQLRFTVAC